MSCLKNSASQFLQQPPERQIQARCVVAAYNLSFLSPSNFHILLSLLGTSDDSIFSAANFIHSLISSLCPPQNQPSVELTAQFLAKDRINSSCLMDPYSPDGPQRSVKAYAIYPKASLFNHDCLPNACRSDYMDNSDPGDETNTDIVIRMIQDVPAGREVCISYFRINKDYETGKKILMEDYEFVCNCERCKIEANKEEDSDFLMLIFFLNMFVVGRTVWELWLLCRLKMIMHLMF